MEMDTKSRIKDFKSVDQRLAELIRSESAKAKSISEDAKASIAKTKAAVEAVRAVRINPTILETVATQADASKRIAASHRNSMTAFEEYIGRPKTSGYQPFHPEVFPADSES